MKQNKFLLSGGGTGGHIFPAISIADELCKKFPSSEILFVGSSQRMEMQKIPESGYRIKGIWISGIKRKLHFSNLLIPLKIISSLIKSFLIINKFKPDFVIGTGGFASGPLVFVASKLKIPTLIQEQNSYPGLTNKILSKTVDLICVAYSNMDKYFPKSKIVFTGNPIRKEIRNPFKSKNESLEQFKMGTSKKTLLVLGGSLGAQKINNFISNNIDLFKSMQIQIIWQCGKIYYNQYKKYNSNEVNVQPFIKDMNSVYSAADIIVSRSGASVISELCIVGKPVIFIPSPNLAEDHQTKNALFIKQNNAAEMVEEKHLEKDFFDVLKKLVSNNKYALKLSKKIKVLEKPNATNEIVELIKKALSDV